MKIHKFIPVKLIRFPVLVFVIALVVTGCSGSSDVPVDDTASESSESTAVDPESSPDVSQPSQATVRVDFNIMVPAYMSNELQVRLDWGDINATAAFISDESWSVSENFPSNTENLLTVTFADRNGGITLGTVEKTFRTGTNASENVQISADEFDTEKWDSDDDGVSNLDELLAGSNPDGNDLLQPVQASLELLPIKTFRISWQTIPNAQFYRVLENPDGLSGFTDISGELEANTTIFDHQVALFSRVNAQYLVQSCNDQGCVDSEPVMVTGTLDNAIGYVKASNTETRDGFGWAVSLSADGNTLAVAAPFEDSAATGGGGDQNDNSLQGAGAVYVFVRRDELWQQQAYLKASNTGEFDNFGRGMEAISLSADGDILAVGASGEDSAATGINGDQNNNSADSSGAAYVFVRNGELWQQQAYLKASNTNGEDLFGIAVSLSADGNTLAVGASEEDSAATGINGDQNDNAEQDSGSVYVFIRIGALWQQQAYFKASNTEEFNRFGRSVSLSADGNTLAVGAFGEDSAATGINGDQNNNSADFSGAAYVFVRSDGLWQQQAYLKASNTNSEDLFGIAVSLNADGNTLAVGATGEDSVATGTNGDQNDNSSEEAGAAYVFIRVGALWQQQAYLKASNAVEVKQFGSAVSLSVDGDILAIGAPSGGFAASNINGDQNDNSPVFSGAAYVFIRSDGRWQQQALLKASNPEAGDLFGETISLSTDGDTLAVGASGEDSSAVGINGDQNDNSSDRAGATYLY